jgi:hypothetical protein
MLQLLEVSVSEYRTTKGRTRDANMHLLEICMNVQRYMIRLQLSLYTMMLLCRISIKRHESFRRLTQLRTLQTYDYTT